VPSSVPKGVTLTAVMRYNGKPFPVTVGKAEFTLQ
jgi:hypothetical protein